MEAEALAAVLGRTTDTSDEFRRVISGALGASTTGSGAMEAMSVGRLAKTDWKVEFVTSSSRCKALRAPLVQMVFHVADGYGGVRVQPVEMTVAEFEVRRCLWAGAGSLWLTPSGLARAAVSYSLPRGSGLHGADVGLMSSGG